MTNILQMQRGASGSCADDTKGMKGAIINWITPEGQTLNPPLNHRYKHDQEYQHHCIGALLCPTGIHGNMSK